MAGGALRGGGGVGAGGVVWGAGGGGVGVGVLRGGGGRGGVGKGMLATAMGEGIVRSVQGAGWGRGWGGVGWDRGEGWPVWAGLGREKLREQEQEVMEMCVHLVTRRGMRVCVMQRCAFTAGCGGEMCVCVLEVCVRCRMWDVEREENFVLNLETQSGYERDERITCISYSANKGESP